jgi:ubiquinone/menaquinone biosynthesis C-methylase UbiE
VIGVDASETMVAAAREADPDGEYVAGDAAALPLPDGHADLVVAFMSLMERRSRMKSTGGRVLDAY